MDIKSHRRRWCVRVAIVESSYSASWNEAMDSHSPIFYLTWVFGFKTILSLRDYWEFEIYNLNLELKISHLLQVYGWENLNGFMQLKLRQLQKLIQ